MTAGIRVNKCARRNGLKLWSANRARSMRFNRAVQDCGWRLNQSRFRPMAEVSFLPSANTRKRASASRELASDPGVVNTPSRFMLLKLEISAGIMGHLACMLTFSFYSLRKENSWAFELDIHVLHVLVTLIKLHVLVLNSPWTNNSKPIYSRHTQYLGGI